MREYHKWLRKATGKTVIPHLEKIPGRSTLSNRQSAKLTSSLQAAVHYVNGKSKDKLSAAATMQLKCSVAAAQLFNTMRRAWK